MILHQGKTKLAGKLVFDAALYPNNKLKAKYEEFSLENCPDKKAKLCLEVRVHEIGDYTSFTTPIQK